MSELWWPMIHMANATWACHFFYLFSTSLRKHTGTHTTVYYAQQQEDELVSLGRRSLEGSSLMMQSSLRRKLKLLVLAHTAQSPVNTHTWTRRKLCHPSDPRLGEGCVSPWAWGILDMTMLMSTIHIHSGLHLLLTRRCCASHQKRERINGPTQLSCLQSTAMTAQQDIPQGAMVALLFWG